jgi:hypothetical protein
MKTSTRAKAVALALALALVFIAPASVTWNDRQKPFDIFGNTWYVGTKELPAILNSSPPR